jgi:hypothetical protein
MVPVTFELHGWLTLNSRGLKLSGQRLPLILGYLGVALGVIIILVPVWFCVWRFSKRGRKKEYSQELQPMDDQNYR